jgi:beta-lactamase regulating signal transducer with metallopeptidase domain
MIRLLFLLVISTSLCYLYYALVLKRNTFFQSKRFFLLAGLIAPFVVFAFSKVSNFQESETFSEPLALANAVTAETMVSLEAVQTQMEAVSGNHPYLLYGYVLVALVLILTRLGSFFRLLRMLKNAEYSAVSGTRILRVQGISTPFSIINRICIPEDWDEVPIAILLHEKVHIKQGHWLDILVTELMVILLWWNPLIYLYRNAVRLNLEYLADKAVIECGENRVAYQSLLWSSALGQPVNSFIVTHFSTPLKDRIKMIQQHKSSNWKRVFLIAIIPLSFLLMAFSAENGLSKSLMREVRPIAIGLSDQLVLENNIPNAMPIRKEELIKITSNYGMRLHPILKVKTQHNGVDILAKAGTPVYATADGEVETSEIHKLKGKYVVINHSELHTTTYHHLSKLAVDAGEEVKQGQLIGYVGTTGESNGPHLHYEIHEMGEPVDPLKYLKLE